MSTYYKQRSKPTTKKKDSSLSDLALKGIKKAEQGLGKTKNAIRFYKKHPTTCKVVGVGIAGLLVYLSRKEDKPANGPTKGA